MTEPHTEEEMEVDEESDTVTVALPVTEAIFVVCNGVQYRVPIFTR